MRLFVAIGLPAETCISLGHLRGSINGARWVMGSDLHLTLSFIGDGADGDIRDLEPELASIDFPAFELALSGLGTFEHRRKIHTMWAGVESAPALIMLHQKIEGAVARAGYSPPARKYKPHVTLARFSRSSDPAIGSYMAANNTLVDGDFSARSFSLYRSHLGHSGARYEILSTYELTEMTY